MSAALATVAEEEELREGGPAVGRLPLVTEFSMADVPRQTAAAFTNLFEYGTACRQRPLTWPDSVCSQSQHMAFLSS